MRRLRCLMFAAPLLVATACSDSTAPRIAATNNGSASIQAPASQPTSPQISSNGYHTCALKTDATVICWGQNTYGQTAVPAGLASVRWVGTGQFHTCAVKIDGTVVCWGWSTYGQTTPPAGLASAVSVSGGAAHTCALKTDATVVCWGYAGDGATSVPAGLSSVKQVSAGGYHTCALKTDGTVVCWGYNAYGESTVPGGLSNVAQINGGVWYTCAVKTDASVVCWGANGGENINFGQQIVPPSLPPVSQVSSGGQHTCALQMSGAVACWGDNEFGQSTVPGGLSSATQISTGYFHSCALKSDGTVVCWGENPDGETTVPAGFNVVAPVPQSISFTLSPPSPAIVGAGYVPTATATSGLAVQYTAIGDACVLSGATVVFVAPGQCTVAVDQSGSSAYLSAPRQTQSFTIVTASQAIQNLMAAIGGMNLPNGVSTSLSASLKNVNTSNVSAACGKLANFVSTVDLKLANGQLTSVQAAELLHAAAAIAASLGCG